MDEKGPIYLLVNGREIEIPGPLSSRRPKSARSCVDEKNYLRENVQKMRQVQKKNKSLEEEKQIPIKPLWKSKRYENVESRIGHYTDTESNNVNRPFSASFLKAHSRSGPSVQDSSRPFTPKEVSKKVSVPPAAVACEFKPIRHNYDFVKVNGKSAKCTPCTKNPEAEALESLSKKREEDFQRHKYGELPKYLQNRREQWKKEEEERIANTPDASLPPGHKMMPEDERLQTLQVLQNNEKELVKKLSALPLRNDTFWVRSQKIELEKQLKETEEALKIFTRSKVFVKCDN